MSERIHLAYPMNTEAWPEVVAGTLTDKCIPRYYLGLNAAIADACSNMRLMLAVVSWERTGIINRYGAELLRNPRVVWAPGGKA